jgi:AraC-like DNA-binding protein
MRRLAQFERISIEPTSSFYLARRRSDSFPLRLHYHPEIELTLIVHGRGMRFVGDSIQTFADGDLCLLGANALHSWQSAESVGRCEAVVIQLREELLTRLSQWPELRRFSNLPQQCVRGLQFVGRSRDRLAELMLEASETPSGSAARLLKMIEMLQCIASAGDAVELSSAPPGPPQADPAFARFQHVIDALHRQMPDAPPQAAMAQAAGLTPATFSRFFKRMVGRGYVDYVNAWRVGLACRQLVQTDEPVTRIAFTCGFENLSNFNRRFRQYKKMTPRQYRKMVKA